MSTSVGEHKSFGKLKVAFWILAIIAEKLQALLTSLGAIGAQHLLKQGPFPRGPRWAASFQASYFNLHSLMVTMGSHFIAVTI